MAPNKNFRPSAANLLNCQPLNRIAKRRRIKITAIKIKHHFNVLIFWWIRMLTFLSSLFSNKNEVEKSNTSIVPSAMVASPDLDSNYSDDDGTIQDQSIKKAMGESPDGISFKSIAKSAPRFVQIFISFIQISNRIYLEGCR